MFPPGKWKHILVWKWRYQKGKSRIFPNKLAWNLVLKVKISNHESENIQTSLSQVTSCFFQDYQTLNIHKKSCESWDWSNEASAVEGQGPEVVCWFIWASWKKGPVWLFGVDMESQGLSIPNLDAWVGWLVGWLGYIGDEILTSFINNEIRIPFLANQDSIKSRTSFFRAHL